MRFRNVKPRDDRQTGNSRTSLLGRSVRSRLFAAMDMGRPFNMPDLAYPDPANMPQPQEREEKSPGVRQNASGPWEEEVGKEVDWELQPERPVPPMTDVLPPRIEPRDDRVGGVDYIDPGLSPPVRTYDVTGTNTSRDLNVSSPTAANCARVLSELLTDLQRNDLLRRV